MTNPTVVIYENLAKMCEWRGARVTERESADRLMHTLETKAFARIDAERENDIFRGSAHISVIMFSPHYGVEGTKISAQINRMMENLEKEKREMNLIFVTIAPISTQVARNIAAINARNAGRIIVEQHLAKIFAIVVPEHAAVPRHTIVAMRGGHIEEEIKNISATMHIAPWRDFPCLVASAKYDMSARPDPMAVWLGLRPGMIVRIERACEVTGIEIVYRRCI
jgi:DNA-directed RNA polymerase subunit H (RpoH/RPB5)